MSGAAIVRTHDVAETVQALRVADAITVLRDRVLALPAPGPDAARLMQDRGRARLVRGTKGLA